MLLGLVARQRHQPSLGFRRDRRLLARSRSVIECRQRAIGQRPLDAALDRLMMDPKSLPNRKERRILAVGEQHLRPLHPARRLGARPRNARQLFNLLIAHRQLDRLPPSCHDATPRPSTINEESTTTLPVPPNRTCQTLPDLWNRSSSHRACAMASARQCCNCRPARVPQPRREPSSSRSFASPPLRSNRQTDTRGSTSAIRRATGTAGGLQLLWLFLLRGRVLDSFSHFLHINARLVHICRVQSARTAMASEPISSAEIVCISSEGLCLRCQYRNSLLGRLGRHSTVRRLTIQRECTSLALALVLAFVRSTERFQCHYQGVSHAEWPKDQYE